ncbi:MAG: AAA family ATPase, partial [Elusimicrobiaceae bacterium]
MLKTLSVKNFAVIDDLHVEFGQGLNVFSGETGAGKSVLVGALGFALGGRASAVVIRSGAGRMEVSAVFSSESLGAALRAKYAISGETFTLRRELDCKGRGRAYVNGSPVSVSVLADIGAGLVDFHGQHDHQTLLKPSVHLELLDRFGGLEKAVDEIRLLVRKLRELENRLQSQAMSKEEKERLLDLYRFQADEIAGAHLRAGEDAEIAERLPRLKNAEKLASLSGQAYALLYADEGSAVEKAGAAIKLVSELAEIDAGFNSAADMLNGALAQLEEVSSEISACAKGIVSDSAELDSVLARDENIKRLKMKYGPDIPDVLNRQEELKRKIDDLDFSDLKEGEIRTEMESVRRKLVPLCSKLHDARMKAG